MRFRRAIQDTNRVLMVFLKHDHWELKEACRFYKQGLKDIAYATKNLIQWLVFAIAVLLIPAIYIFAVLYRVIKVRNTTNDN